MARQTARVVLFSIPAFSIGLALGVFFVPPQPSAQGAAPLVNQIGYVPPITSPPVSTTTIPPTTTTTVAPTTTTTTVAPTTTTTTLPKAPPTTLVAKVVATTTTAPPRPVATHDLAPVASSGWGPAFVCVIDGESQGNWAEDTGNGYYGAAQWLPVTWNAAAIGAGYGGYANGRADLAPAWVQEAVMVYWQRVAGWGQWPQTSAACHL